MKSASELWKVVYASFEYHRKPGDESAQAALDRIAKKCLGLNERKSFNPGNCSVCEVILTADELQSIEVYHSRNQPMRMEGPIVILVYGGIPYVIEGNTRINAWRANKYNGPFSAILLELQDEQG